MATAIQEATAIRTSIVILTNTPMFTPTITGMGIWSTLIPMATRILTNMAIVTSTTMTKIMGTTICIPRMQNTITGTTAMR